MTKFNITLAVSAETLPSLMNDLPVYCAELVRVEQLEASAPVPQVAAKPKRPNHAGRNTTTLEVYRAAERLYKDTQAPFRSVEVWRALRAEGSFPTKGAVYQHLQQLRNMGLITAVSGRDGSRGYGNIIRRHIDDSDFEAFRDTLTA